MLSERSFASTIFESLSDKVDYANGDPIEPPKARVNAIKTTHEADKDRVANGMVSDGKVSAISLGDICAELGTFISLMMRRVK